MEVITKKLLTVAEVAAMLNLGRTLVYELVLRGELTSLTIGRARRIPVSAVEAFIHERLEASSGDGHPATTTQGEVMRHPTTNAKQQPKQAPPHQQVNVTTTETEETRGRAA